MYSSSLRTPYAASSSGIIQVIIALVFGLIILLPAHAVSLTDARQSYQSGQYKKALSQVNSVLKTAPQDSSAMFLKAQILSDSQQPAAAIKHYQALISIDSLNLEAYNNLATIYAEQGNLKLASETLEAAIKSDPVYDTLHSNLRAIYLDLSKKHYRQALKLKPDTGTTQLITLNNANFRKSQATTPVLPVNDKRIAKANTTGRSTDTITSDPEEMPSTNLPKSPKIATKTASAAQTKAVGKIKAENEASHAAQSTPSHAKETVLEAQDDVRVALLSWANAWSNRDSTRYLNAYLSSYTITGKTNSEWAAGRRWNFKNKQFIKVALSNIRIVSVGNTARATFTQAYESNTYRDSTPKELIFVRQDNQWKITQERSG